MADATAPSGQRDVYQTINSHGFDPRYSDSDGMQFFDFDAFGKQFSPQRQAPYGVDDGMAEFDMAEEPTNLENYTYLPDSPMNGEDFEGAAEDDVSDVPSADEEADPDEDSSDDGETALFEAALASYRNDNPLLSGLVPRPPKDFEQQLADPDGVTHLEQLPSFEALRGNEKWHVEKESAEFLASVMALTSDQDLDEVSQRPIRNPLRKLRLEEPVVETHPEMAMIKLFKRNEVHLSNDGIELFPVNVEKDESLEWSKAAQELPKKLHREMKNAKLEIDGETMKYLGEIAKGPDVDLDDWLRQDRERRLPPPPLSPKLLPLSPPYSPGEMDPEAAELKLTSSPVDPSANELGGLAAKILKRDNVRMEIDADEAAKSWDGFAASSSSPLQRKVKRRSDFKVSSPLLPLEIGEPPSKRARTVSFPDDLETLIPEFSDDDLPDDGEVAAEVLAATNSIVRSAGEKMQQRLLGEELAEADTTMRVELPAVDEIKAVPPWEAYAGADGNFRSLNSQRRLINEAQDTLEHSEVKWSVSSKAERQLHWVPFPMHLGKMKPEGNFDDGSLARYLQELDINDDVDLECLIWKPDGLRVLDRDEDEDDELEVADIESDFEEPEQEPEPEVVSPPQMPVPRAVSPQKNPPVSTIQSNAKTAVQSWTPMDELLAKRKIQLEEDRKAFSNASQMDIFARAQGLSSKAPQAPTTTLTLNNRPSAEQSAAEPDAELFAPTRHETTISVPEIHHPSRPYQIIISHTLLKNHTFVRKLQKHLPSIDLIERNFTSPEADITLSPSTGLLFTTLQKLKQKPLPGQTSSNSIRDRIATIAPRYETLLVLVSDERENQPLDERDTASLTDLITHTTTSSPETTIQILYIPGGTSTLAHYTAAAISLYSSSNEEQSLLRDETLWERFLRSAGLNAYAALVVLESLKSIAEGKELAAFVMMSPDERIQRFGPMMGGDGVLRRVNRVLEGKWTTF